MAEVDYTLVTGPRRRRRARAISPASHVAAFEARETRAVRHHGVSAYQEPRRWTKNLCIGAGHRQHRERATTVDASFVMKCPDPEKLEQISGPSGSTGSRRCRSRHLAEVRQAGLLPGGFQGQRTLACRGRCGRGASGPAVGGDQGQPTMTAGSRAPSAPAAPETQTPGGDCRADRAVVSPW